MKPKALVHAVIRRTKLLALSGRRFYCPICQGRYRRFLSAGTVPRTHAQCPGCGSLERHRLLWLTLQELWRSQTISLGGRMLHVAPEPALAKCFRREYDYLSVDLAGVGAMEAMDIRTIALPDQTFDAVVCNHVLEHIPEDQLALAELYRILKPGSWASIQVPIEGETTDEDLSITDPNVRTQRYGQPDHVRQYGRDFRARLEAVGFKVLIIPKAERLDQATLAKISVASESDVWICLKTTA